MLLPIKNEMLVLPYEAPLVCGRLLARTRKVEKEYVEQAHEGHWFHGWIGSNFRFTISRRTKHVEHFLPLISGSIEPTSKGCIVFIRYRLFFGTRLLLFLWLLVTGSMALLFTFQEKNLLYASICGFSGLLYFVFLRINFYMQCKKDQKLLHQTFGIE
ncbi:hypothetical protein QWY31_14900 [Cytophagales bacterium LB-30]|uniref:Uncharacterized protein n=1 Tax=Shiella aurantiaca TaxID=3058365 RepID=A0ABT8F8I8_9BACT|nr:hypothetical protein [Shiella aurantiaca]MDN4166798.1 hypothetical protein [Shiella aurantiaca]